MQTRHHYHHRCYRLPWRASERGAAPSRLPGPCAQRPPAGHWLPTGGNLLPTTTEQD